MKRFFETPLGGRNRARFIADVHNSARLVPCISLVGHAISGKDSVRFAAQYCDTFGIGVEQAAVASLSREHCGTKKSQRHL
jgi:hypothetical protein